MKRAFFEWGAMLWGMVAVLCLGLWCFGLVSDATDFTIEFTLGPRGARWYPQIALSRGAVAWCSDYPNDVVLDRPTTFFNGHAAARNLRFAGMIYCREWDSAGSGEALTVALPGVQYRSCDVFATEGWTAMWDLRVSLLVPCVATGLLAALSIQRWRAVLRCQREEIACHEAG